MKTMLVVLLVLPVTVVGQMMPERLVPRDTTGLRRAVAVSNAETKRESVALSVAKASENAITQIPSRKDISPMSSFEFWLSIIILGFTLLIIAAEMWLFRSGVLPLSTDAAGRIVLVTLIIGGTMFLISAGYSNDQIAPAVGLFGTIAGYLLGRSVASTDKSS